MPRRTPSKRTPSRKNTASRRGCAQRAPQRLGPLFFTVLAVTGLCALAFMGLVASVMAGA